MISSSLTVQQDLQDAFLPCGGFQAAIFDPDGVLVDTAKCHYLAWQQLARELGFGFPESANEAVKGVSRQESLMLGAAGKQILAGKKNHWYQELPGGLDAMIDGAKIFASEPNPRIFLLGARKFGVPPATYPSQFHELFP